MASDRITVRQGTVADVPAVFGLVDDDVRWLAERGRTEQWGSGPLSADPCLVRTVTGWAAGGDLYLADLDRRVVGAVAVGPVPAHVPALAEPELYVNLLVTDRAHTGLRVANRLLAQARQLAAERGLGLLRVDCDATDDPALIRYYQRQGFSTATSSVLAPGRAWPGQIMVHRIG